MEAIIENCDAIYKSNKANKKEDIDNNNNNNNEEREIGSQKYKEIRKKILTINEEEDD